MEKLWVAGRASENREGWAEEVRAHCEKCHYDKDEMSEVQAVRIRGHGSRVQIIIDGVLRARGTLMKNEEDGLCDCLVTEMLQDVPMVSVYEITH